MEPNDEQQQPQTPEQPQPLVRDRRTGQFVVGHPGGPGRPRGSKRVVLADEASRLCEETGIDLGQAVQQVVRRMLERATKDGDVQAARLLLEGLTHSPESEAAQQAQAACSVAQGPQGPTGQAAVDYCRQLAAVGRTMATQMRTKGIGDPELEEARSRLADAHADLLEMRLKAGEDPSI